MVPLPKIIFLLLLKFVATLCYNDFLPTSSGNKHGNQNKQYPQSFGGTNQVDFKDKEYALSSMVSDDGSISRNKGFSKYDRIGSKREEENPHPWNPPMDDISYKTLKELSRIRPTYKDGNKQDPQLHADDTDDLNSIILQDDAKLLLSLLLLDQLKNSPKIGTARNSPKITEKDVARLYHNTRSMPPYDYRDLYSSPLIASADGTMEVSDNEIEPSIKIEGLTAPRKAKSFSFKYGRLSVPTAKRKHGYTYYYGVEIPRYNPYD